MAEFPRVPFDHVGELVGPATWTARMEARATDRCMAIIRRQDELIEDLRHDLATAFRWSRWGLGLLACFLSGGIVADIADIAVGSPPVVPLVRLGGIALALVAYRRVRAAERERGL